MTSADRSTSDDYFRVGFRLNGSEVVGFDITSRSSRGKQWAFFGLLTMLIVSLLVSMFYPLIEPFLI